MTSLKVGDLVIASRRSEGSSILTGVEHHTTILSFTRSDRYGRRHVTVKYHKHVAGFPDIDTIKMKSGRGDNETVLTTLPTESESPLMSSQSSASSESSIASESELSTTQTYCVTDR